MDKKMITQIHGSQYMENGKNIISNTEVGWAGSGGYWHRADINYFAKKGWKEAFFSKKEFEI